VQLKIVQVEESKRKPQPPADTQLGFGRVFSDHMMLMEFEPGKGRHDARIEPYHQLSFDPACMALHYAQQVFDGLKAYRGVDEANFTACFDSELPIDAVLIKAQRVRADFEMGLQVVAKLTEGPVYVCKAPDSSVRTPSGSQFSTEEFAGPHPAGTAGLHIHFLMPVNRKRTVWHLNYQDVISVGRLFATGALDVERVVSLAGPSVREPRLLRTRIGASTDELAEGRIEEGEQRVVSGSVFSGRQAEGEIDGYLGRYHLQVAALPEGRQRELIGWLLPGPTKFSTINAYVGRLIPGQRFRMTTNTNGSHRAMVPTGMHEDVMPMDILPTFLLRALLVQDIEKAEELGVLELDEEDLALCTFVDIGKNEYGPLLRQMLTTIEKEG